MATTAMIKHTTQTGDRWDLLAWKYYGDPGRYAPIISANPAIPVYPVLPPGLDVYIPFLPAAVSRQNLPPWTRAAQQLGQIR